MNFSVFLQIAEKVHFNEVLFLLTISKQDQESLSAPSPDCLCKTEASAWSCSINPNRTRNLSMISLLTVSAGQASQVRSGNFPIHRTIL